MNIDKSKLNYRKSAVGVVVDKDNKIVLVQKAAYKDNEWDFPGGGIEENETDSEAVLRELEEELGTNKLEIVSKSKIVDKYEWPDEVIERKLKNEGKTWRGQERTQFLVRFLGDREDVSFQKGELKGVVWVSILDSFKYFVFPNQADNAKRLFGEFGLINF